MGTVAVGSTESVRCPLAGTITVTPTIKARVAIISVDPAFSNSLISSETTFDVSAGDVVNITAIDGAVTYTEPAFTADQVQGIQRGSLVLAQRGAAASHTGTTSETLLIPSVEIPVGAMGLNSVLRIEAQFQMTANTNSRTNAIKCGPSLGAAATLWTRTRNSATALQESPLVILANRGSLSSQIYVGASSSNYATNQNATSSTFSIDFSVTNYIYITGTLSNSADTITLDFFQARIETV